jgi:predicted nucleotidyltransferase
VARSVRQLSLTERLLAALGQDGESHGRALAAAVSADSGAVARCLVRLEQRGLLHSRWVGRTRLYRLNSSRKRRLDPLVGEAVKRLKRVDHPKPLAVLPFGSRTTGYAGPDSDVDIIVVVPDGQNTTASWQRFADAVRNLPVPVDLLLYSRSNAEKWASLPANPLRTALELQPNASLKLRIA